MWSIFLMPLRVPCAGPKDVLGLIMAGGRSSRMGTDKALLEIGGQAMALRLANTMAPLVDQVIISGDPDKHASLGCEVWEADRTDIGTGTRGPMQGIAAALRRSTYEFNLVCACDLAYMTREWMSYLLTTARQSEADMVMGLGLCIVYRKRAVEGIDRALKEGAYKFKQTMVHLSYVLIPEDVRQRYDPDGVLFLDVDDPTEFAAAKAWLEGRERGATSARSA